MSHFTKTPEPPYYAVIASFTLRDDMDETEYNKYRNLAASMVELAKEVPGFYGEETGRGEDFSITVSYWKDEDAISIWRENVKHEAARKIGKKNWYKHVVTRVAKVERDSEFRHSG